MLTQMRAIQNSEGGGAFMGVGQTVCYGAPERAGNTYFGLDPLGPESSFLVS